MAKRRNKTIVKVSIDNVSYLDAEKELLDFTFDLDKGDQLTHKGLTVKKTRQGAVKFYTKRKDGSLLNITRNKAIKHIKNFSSIVDKSTLDKEFQKHLESQRKFNPKRINPLTNKEMKERALQALQSRVAGKQKAYMEMVDNIEREFAISEEELEKLRAFIPAIRLSNAEADVEFWQVYEDLKQSGMNALNENPDFIGDNYLEIFKKLFVANFGEAVLNTELAFLDELVSYESMM